MDIFLGTPLLQLSLLAARCLREVLEKVPDVTSHQIIVHTDRGAEFVSNDFQNLEKDYPLLRFSMSATATPLDNALAESLWSSLGKLKDLWGQVGHSSMPYFVNEEEGKQVWASFFELYNARHKGVRSLRQTADFAEAALQAAFERGIDPALILLLTSQKTLMRSGLKTKLLFIKKMQ